jgi:hypothetical protein
MKTDHPGDEQRIAQSRGVADDFGQRVEGLVGRDFGAARLREE